MSALFNWTSGPGNGIFPNGLDATVTARTAVSAGELLMFDLQNSDGSVSNLNPGDVGSGFSNVVNPSAGAVVGTAPAVFCVALEAIADDAEGKVRYFGEVDALCIRASGNIAVGDDLVGTAGANLDGIVASGELVIALAAEAKTAPTSATLTNVFFMGTLLGSFATTEFS